MPGRKIGWAVVGLGQQGERLATAIAASGHELVATASERQPGSFAAVLRNPQIDAIAVATPNDAHMAPVMAAAKAEKHVLCEKPLAVASTEGSAMRSAVRRANVHCFVNYHLRMHAEVQQARRVIESGRLGDITHIEMHWSVGALAKKPPPLPPHMAWREDPERAGGGALAARGTHLFDLLRYLTGAEATVAQAWSDATPRLVDRTAVGVLLMNTTPAVVTTSKAIRAADNRIVFYGTRGKLVLRDIFLADPQRLYEAVFKAFALELRGKKTALATIDDGLAAITLTEAFAAAAARDTSP
jgi:1,5-anhydro-D-fructose reductase (1,5-anhydro-D-mannitol-forming)